MDSFKKRLQRVMDVKKIPPIEVSRGIGVDRARISNWLSGKVSKPRRATLQKLSAFFGCNIEWLADGTGEIFPTPETKPVGPSASFQDQRKAKHVDDTLTLIKRERFKQQCGTHFEEFFDFVADTYGENKEGIDDFLTELHRTNGNYREWLERKKWIKKNSQDEIDTDIVA